MLCDYVTYNKANQEDDTKCLVYITALNVLLNYSVKLSHNSKRLLLFKNTNFKLKNDSFSIGCHGHSFEP